MRNKPCDEEKPWQSRTEQAMVTLAKVSSDAVKIVESLRKIFR